MFLQALTLDAINTSVAAAGVLSFLLGLLVYARNRTNIVNLSFLWFALTVGTWSIALVVYRNPSFIEHADFAARMLYVSAALIPASYIVFVRLFESDSRPSFNWYAGLLIPCSIMVAVSAIPQALILDVHRFQNSEPHILFHAWLHYAYFIYIVAYGTGGMYLLYSRYLENKNATRNKLLYIMIGTFIPLSVSVASNLLLPAFGVFTYNWVGQLSTFGMIAVIAYGMFRHQIFDVRVITTEFLLFIIWSISFARILSSASLLEIVVDITAFTVLIFVGIFLVRSVYREIEQRELIQSQQRELSLANQKQENLLHFMSHEIKGYLTEAQNAFASIVDGDFGEAPPKVRDLAQTALAKMRRGVSTIMDILDAANMKKGTVSFKEAPFDLRAELETAIHEMRPYAAEHKLKLEASVGQGEFTVVGDAEKIHRHVFRNLIDNAIRYTPEGSIHVTLAREGPFAVLSVKDTGVGITPEDHEKLFTEGGHGKDSIKINVHSTGYGLFIAKQIVDAHNGSIEAHSEGAGKGSEFLVHLPLKQ